MRLLIPFLLALCPCLADAAPPDDIGMAEIHPPLPGPERARAAADRVRPGLERDLSETGLRFGDPVFLRAFKEEQELELWVRRRDNGTYERFRTWKIAALSGKPGPKLAEGDGQVPEGFYQVVPGNMKPDSTFHLAFNIGYPNAFDRQNGRTGSFIMVHGNCVSIGCLAMTDAIIEEIYTLCDAALKSGQKAFPVHIFPFRMTAKRMSREAGNQWFDFWTMLFNGYNAFERTRVPPLVTAKDGIYQIEPAPPATP